MLSLCVNELPHRFFFTHKSILFLTEGFQAFAAIFIVSTLFWVLIANFLCKRMYLPLQHVESLTNCLLEDKQPDDSQQKSVETFLEFKQYEQSLLKAFELLREKNAAERELFQVAAQAAHDICSPVMALQIMHDQIPNLSEEQKDFLHQADASITAIARTLLKKYGAYKDRNFIAKNLQKDKVTIAAPSPSVDAPENISVAKVIDDVIALKKVQFVNVKHVQFASHIDQVARQLKAKVDTNQLQRVLSNLLNNSVEAIAIAKRDSGLVEISLRREKEYIVLSVSDNGCGMSQDLIKKIGTAEYSSGKEGGHGIGLYQAAQMIKTWGGKYTIESEEGRQTKITISLPISES
jgi:signal transduction histidine kinase